MSDGTKIAAGTKQIVFVPLGKLKKSPKNVRKVPHTVAEIKALAEAAEAALAGKNWLPAELRGAPDRAAT